MKRKILISIAGIVLFAVAIGFSFQNNETKNLTVKNIEAMANVQESAFGCVGDGECGLVGIDNGKETVWPARPE